MTAPAAMPGVEEIAEAILALEASAHPPYSGPIWR